MDMDHNDERGAAGHIAAITPSGNWFLVTCPQGCNLGTSADQPDRAGAERRVIMHSQATTPLTPHRGTAGCGNVNDDDEETLNFAGESGDEPEPADYDPGPEVDDEGGMSEYRYPQPGDYPR